MTKSLIGEKRNKKTRASRKYITGPCHFTRCLKRRFIIFGALSHSANLRPSSFLFPDIIIIVCPSRIIFANIIMLPFFLFSSLFLSFRLLRLCFFLPMTLETISSCSRCRSCATEGRVCSFGRRSGRRRTPLNGNNVRSRQHG